MLVYSTVWFWLGAACILGGIHMALGIRGDPGNSQILLWSGPSILLLGGYQRDYDVAGYVLVGLSFILLVCLVYVSFQDTFSSSKASRKTTKNEGELYYPLASVARRRPVGGLVNNAQAATRTGTKKMAKRYELGYPLVR